MWPDAVGDTGVGAGTPALVTVDAHEGCASCVAVEGDRIATGGFDGVVRLWRLTPPTAADPTPSVIYLRQVPYRAWASARGHDARATHARTVGATWSLRRVARDVPCASRAAGGQRRQ